MDMYFCNKCGHSGYTGPMHHKPAQVGSSMLTMCHYEAVKLPSSDQISLHSVANVVAQFIPDGMEIRLCMEHGAAWVELHAHSRRLPLPDAADRDLVGQINDAMRAALHIKPASYTPPKGQR